MISYAQNAEDVVLARLFAGRASGCYVDVGAGDPVADSVTKHFHDRGWRGVNVEPNPDLAARLETERPDDVTLRVAVGDRRGSRVLHIVQDDWGRTTLDGELATRYRAEEGRPVVELRVDVVTLDDVLARCDRPIDFLKIDVEGAEHQVVAGSRWREHRPRVLVVEATEPGRSTPSHEKWEPVLLDAGYRCALFDGLNRFYAEADDDEALTVLAAPANVFDSYERHAVERRLTAFFGAHRAYLQRLETELGAAHAATGTATTRAADLEREVERLTAELAAARRLIGVLESRRFDPRGG